MIGTSLGHYQILEILGKGGMGEVFLAEDTKLHRKVALKVLPSEFSESASRVERFEREARAVAALDHPNIVTIYSVEEIEGTHFITMQALEGDLLSSRVPPSGLPLEEFFDIALPLAEALSAAHAKGVTHRDIKPKNILITRKGTVKVLDFGLAKLDRLAVSSSDVDQETLELTQPGVVMGTAAYMSPEQLQGNAIDSRSDLFSLGVVLYQMATGRRPFRGRTTVAVATSILRDTPPPISDHRKDLPRALSSLVHRCLEVGLEDRFQSATELKAALLEVREKGDSTSSILTGWRTTAHRPKRRWPRLALFVLLGAAILAGAAWLGRSSEPWFSGSEARAEIRIAVLPFESVGPKSEEWFTKGLTDEITNRLGAMGGLRVASRTSATRYKENRPSVPEIGKALGVDYLLVGTVRWSDNGEDGRKVRITPKLIRVADDTLMWAAPDDFSIDDIFQVQTQIAEAVVQRVGQTLLSSDPAPSDPHGDSSSVQQNEPAPVTP